MTDIHWTLADVAIRGRDGVTPRLVIPALTISAGITAIIGPSGSGKEHPLVAVGGNLARTKNSGDRPAVSAR